MSTKSVDFRQRQQAEVDANFAEFQKLLKGNKIESDKYGMFALMKSCEIKGFFTTWEDADQAGKLLHKSEPFSIQEVTNRIVDLGFFSHAIV